MPISNGKPLRFAALVRVSTDGQKERGESLRTQQTYIAEAVKHHGGKVVATYGGSEHATTGWERKEVERLLADAAKSPKPFDAVIVFSESRWSRDNELNKRGIRVFKTHKIRFFVYRREIDVYSPKDNFWMGIQSEIGELFASEQNQLSLINKIERAKRGCPTVGSLPVGRTFDKRSEKWGIDEKKQSEYEDIAQRYLAGEKLRDLANEYGIDYSGLLVNLKTKCGDEWIQTYRCDFLNINETIPTKIPRLLGKDTIKAIQKKIAANLTWDRTKDSNKFRKYLLSGLIRCSHCGKTMDGQTHRNAWAYYRHARPDRLKTPCRCPVDKRPLPVAKLIEENVLRRLFEVLQNPKRLQAAVDAATPDKDKEVELQKQLASTQKALQTLMQSRERIVRQVAAGTLSDDEITSEMNRIRPQIEKQEAKRQVIIDQLRAIPNARDVKRLSFKQWDLKASSQVYSRMTWEEKRHLLVSVLGGTQPDGKPCGVFINWFGGRKGPQWTFSIRGMLDICNVEEVLPTELEKLGDKYDDPAMAEWKDRKRKRKAKGKSRGTRLSRRAPVP